MTEVIRQTRKAKKILTEFNLKNDEKLRIYVYFWGDKEYAQKLGYHGNTIYKPMLVDKDGFEKAVYKGKKGLPTLNELKSFYDDWNERLARRTDRIRLREVANILYELSEWKTCFDKRQAHVVYQLLRMVKGGPTFRITKPSDADNLDVTIAPAIVVSFKGYESLKRFTHYVHGTKFMNVLKVLQTYNDQTEKIVGDLRQDLANFAESEGLLINLEKLADHVDEQMVKVFQEESGSGGSQTKNLR